MKTTTEFTKTLPRTPISQHIAQVHAIVLHLYGQTDGHSVDAVEIAEHCLREIAILAGLSMLDPREQMRWQHRVEPEPVRYDPLSAQYRLTPLDNESMQRAFRNATSGIADAIRKMREGLSRPKREREARMTNEEYLRDVARRERAIAKVHLRREVARVEQELGLSTPNRKDLP